MIERRPFNQLGGEDHGWLKVPEEIARKSHYKLDQAAPIAKIEDLAAYDAIGPVKDGGRSGGNGHSQRSCGGVRVASFNL
jgi:hypothetical protein